MSEQSCEHLAAVGDAPKPPGGCVACLAIGDTWVNLRFCVTCGIVACCDASKNRHARRHAGEAGHPVARSRQPGEMWAWCYPDDEGIDLPFEESWA